MSWVRPENRGRPEPRALRTLLLTASAATLLCAFPAQAQDSGGLRGAVAETDVTGSLLGRGQAGNTQAQNAANQAPADQNPPPQYAPESTGAVPDTTDTAASPDPSLFALPPNTDDPFADDPPPASTRPTSAARKRTEDARNRNTATTQADSETAASGQPAEEVDDDTTTGTVRTPTIDSEQVLKLDEGAERAEAIEGLNRPRDDNPFAATGIRAGSFVLRPSLEQGITATSNASASSGGSSGVLSETTLRLNAVSDWSRHSATIDAYGILRRTLSGEEIKETQAGIDGKLDLELGDELRGHVEAGYQRRPESGSSPVAIEGTLSQPIRQTFNGSLGIEKDVGKARFGITGRVEHDMYGDAQLSTGGVVSQKDRDSTLATLTLRGGYEISPALTPFLEAEVGRRFYDEKVDASGYERSSDRLGARAGVELDLGEKLSGEFSAGWIREGFDDDRLNAIGGPTVNANLAWSPERGTMVNLAASTEVEGSTTAGESGSVFHSARLSVEREIRANLTANAAIGAGYRDYSGSDGHDIIFNAEAGATWWLNRYAGLTGRLRHEQLKSNLEGRDYQANSVFVGLKVQR
ncbi:outer membrane beta-barrel protein [Mesorhizobium sp. CGMCC 1.15528]|uniref:Outer membrane beta-barrel protein n=1 Tax=Mesorhizobium zhangyense TaxID=1776730 RepID=A0A7C9VGT8_9HYPH|nr:outer membrane beta-barrel protein [Mesorhizobium zhangyense]